MKLTSSICGERRWDLAVLALAAKVPTVYACLRLAIDDTLVPSPPRIPFAMCTTLTATAASPGHSIDRVAS
jgi:hypothetical protein